MAENKPDIRRKRLSREDIERNFDDLHPPLSRSEALIEADRCYFCHDAPCVTACPTDIDIPAFHSEHSQRRSPWVRADDPSVPTSWAECAHASVPDRGPVRRSLRPQHATRTSRSRSDSCNGTPRIRCSTDNWTQFFERAEPSTGKRVAVVGGGPAGLSCAHRLACPRPRRNDRFQQSRCQARRAQRVRHRRLQDGRRLRGARSQISYSDMGGIDVRHQAAPWASDRVARRFASRTSTPCF